MCFKRVSVAKTLGNSSRMACGDLFGVFIDGAVVDDERGDILTIGGGTVVDNVAEMGLNNG